MEAPKKFPSASEVHNFQPILLLQPGETGRRESNCPQSCVRERTETGREAGASRVARPAPSSTEGRSQGEAARGRHATDTRHGHTPRTHQGTSGAPGHRAGVSSPPRRGAGVAGRTSRGASEGSRAISVAAKAGSARRLQAAGWHGSRLTASLRRRAPVPPGRRGSAAPGDERSPGRSSSRSALLLRVGKATRVRTRQERRTRQRYRNPGAPESSS